MPFSKVRCLMASGDDYQLRLGNIADRLGEGRTGESRTNYRTTHRVLHAHPAAAQNVHCRPSDSATQCRVAFSFQSTDESMPELWATADGWTSTPVKSRAE